RLVILAERVRQPGVWIGAYISVGHPGELLHVGPQLRGAERAIEADGERLGMADRVPERLGGLPRERASGGIRNRAGDDERQIAAELIQYAAHAVERRLRVQGVKYGLDDEQVGAAQDQRARRLGVARHEL